MDILVGIQPTGKIHLGNYLGCIKKGIELQSKNNVTFLIADLHSKTTLDDKEIQKNTAILYNDLKKLGCTFVEIQSQNKELLKELWDLQCVTNINDLFRLTQYKEKNNIIKNTGLLLYPILMALDIKYSNCTHVLIGEDQLEHLQFANQLFKKIRYKEVIPILTNTPRIKSLLDPTKKMSKSLGEKHCYYLFDNEKINKNKIMKAVTNKEGIKNIEILTKEFNSFFDINNMKKTKEELFNKLYENFNRR